MRVTGRVVEENATRLKRRVALVVDSTIVLATPVDTGRARGNWQVELDGPAQGVSDLLSPSGSESIAAARTRIEQAVSEQPIHITNNLPYIGRLNEGWSAQAPAGFVEESIHNGVAMIRGARITIEGGVE